MRHANSTGERSDRYSGPWWECVQGTFLWVKGHIGFALDDRPLPLPLGEDGVEGLRIQLAPHPQSTEEMHGTPVVRSLDAVAESVVRDEQDCSTAQAQTQNTQSEDEQETLGTI